MKRVDAHRRRWRHVCVGGDQCVAIGSAQTVPKFGSYTLSATAPGWEMTEDEPGAQAHPEGGGTAPYSTSALTSGGNGYGLSSLAWPGATEANADKVALLLFPSTVIVAPPGSPPIASEPSPMRCGSSRSRPCR